ncbi:MAG: 30S ribosomal protein S17 [Candidatus Sericytochromatia bacterium]|nr:30S ribosomal protein S17 [Candidatus Sericytochromatia bacterium]
MMETEAKVARTIVGRVVSNKADKTVTVRLERRVPHSVYGKYMRRWSTFHAHDEENACGEGDLVKIIQVRPLSRTKRWKVVDIVEKSVS